MLKFPTIVFAGPSTTGRPPIWLSLIILKASRINSLLWMLITWTRRNKVFLNLQVEGKLKVINANRYLISRHKRKSKVSHRPGCNAIKPISSSASFKTLDNCRLGNEVYNVCFTGFYHWYIPQPILWEQQQDSQHSTIFCNRNKGCPSVWFKYWSHLKPKLDMYVSFIFYVKVKQKFCYTITSSIYAHNGFKLLSLLHSELL